MQILGFNYDGGVLCYYGAILTINGSGFSSIWREFFFVNFGPNATTFFDVIGRFFRRLFVLVRMVFLRRQVKQAPLLALFMPVVLNGLWFDGDVFMVALICLLGVHHLAVAGDGRKRLVLNNRFRINLCQISLQ